MLILNTVAPHCGPSEGCVLSSLLYSLFTHDCVAKHDSNTIITFADDATVVEQSSFKFLGIHIPNKLSWSKHTKTVVKRA